MAQSHSGREMISRVGQVVGACLVAAWAVACGDAGKSLYEEGRAAEAKGDALKARGLFEQSCRDGSREGCAAALDRWRAAIGDPKQKTMIRTFSTIACDLGDADNCWMSGMSLESESSLQDSIAAVYGDQGGASWSSFDLAFEKYVKGCLHASGKGAERYSECCRSAAKLMARGKVEVDPEVKASIEAKLKQPVER
jgi:hypothetical protein